MKMTIIEAFEEMSQAYLAASKSARHVAQVLDTLAKTAEERHKAQEEVPIMEKAAEECVPEEKEDGRTERPYEKDASQKDPKEAPVSIEQIRAILAEKSQAGLTTKVRDLIRSYGVAKLSDVDPAQYKKLYADAHDLK